MDTAEEVVLLLAENLKKEWEENLNCFSAENKNFKATKLLMCVCLHTRRKKAALLKLCCKFSLFVIFIMIKHSKAAL